MSFASSEEYDYGAFLDAKGHYVGFCSGCEKWHTGVVWLQRRNIDGKVDGDGVEKNGRKLEIIPSDAVHIDVVSKNIVSKDTGNKDIVNANKLATNNLVVDTVVGNNEAKSKIISKKIGTNIVAHIGTNGMSDLKTDKEQTCMSAWENILLSGRFNTDQESMDEAEKIGACPHALVLPSKHLLFAKDYIGMFFTAGQTFLHLTAAG